MTVGLGKVLRTTVVAAIAFVYLFPFTWMVLTGFRRPADTLGIPPKFIFEPTLSGFTYIFEVTGFQWYVLNSFAVASAATVGTLLVAAPAAYAVAHLRVRVGWLLNGLLVARIVPAVAIAVPVLWDGPPLLLRRRYAGGGTWKRGAER